MTYINAYKIDRGKKLSVTTANKQETVIFNGEYMITNTSAAETVYVNTDGQNATAAASMPIPPGDRYVVRCPMGTLNYIGSGSFSDVYLNKVTPNGA